MTGEIAALDVAERIRQTIQDPYLFLPRSIQIAASIGVSTTTGHLAAKGIDQVLRAADQAMYRAKKAGGNQIASAIF